MRKSTWISSVTLVVLSICILVLLVGRVQRRSSGQRDLAKEANGTDSQIVRDRLGIVPNEAPSLTTSPPRLGFEPQRSVEMADLHEVVRHWVSGRMEYLDSVIGSQEPNDVWAENIRGAARDAFKGQDGINVDSVECGQTLCRLEVLGTTPDASGTEKAKIALAKIAPANSEQMLRASRPPAPPKLVFYMTRENARLPNPMAKMPGGARVE